MSNKKQKSNKSKKSKRRKSNSTKPYKPKEVSLSETSASNLNVSNMLHAVFDEQTYRVCGAFKENTYSDGKYVVDPDMYIMSQDILKANPLTYLYIASRVKLHTELIDSMMRIAYNESTVGGLTHKRSAIINYSKSLFEDIENDAFKEFRSKSLDLRLEDPSRYSNVIDDVMNFCQISGRISKFKYNKDGKVVAIMLSSPVIINLDKNDNERHYVDSHLWLYLDLLIMLDKQKEISLSIGENLSIIGTVVKYQVNNRNIRKYGIKDWLILDIANYYRLIKNSFTNKMFRFEFIRNVKFDRAVYKDYSVVTLENTGSNGASVVKSQMSIERYEAFEEMLMLLGYAYFSFMIDDLENPSNIYWHFDINQILKRAFKSYDPCFIAFKTLLEDTRAMQSGRKELKGKDCFDSIIIALFVRQCSEDKNMLKDFNHGWDTLSNN